MSEETAKTGDTLWEAVLEAPPRCPKCRHEETTKRHHAGTFAVPECDFWQCDECEHQWGWE